jgi:hypothetical protein
VVGDVLAIFLGRWRKICTILQQKNRKQGPIPEEIYQTLLTNKKQGNLDEVHAANIFKPLQTRVNREKYSTLTYRVIKSLEHLKI